MNLSIYIAGASAEIERAEAAIAYARSLDLTVTFPWPEDVRAHAATGRTDADLTDHEMQRHVLRDVRGIVEARVVVLLVPAAGIHTTGAWWEAGFATAHRKPVVVSRERSGRRCVFEVLGSQTCATDQAAITLAKFLAQPSPMEAR